MKIKELKDAIANLNDDAEISFLMDSGCCSETETMVANDLETYENSALIVRFNSLPGYKSCLQAGATKRAHEEYWKKINLSSIDL